ncbi:MAG TPA: EAL domain-containing protein [Steroidobacteraceae bacterium]|jgi:diguanylate cyclase (GGDEF)-like protein/PAS domain S-box-containing protein|nr:EAL domain-containing protein [Steroidobacteraceae bacterium]
MIRFGRRHGWWLIALAAFALVWGLHATHQLRPLENAASDLRASLLTREVHSDVVIVGIDAASLAALDQWPWPRSHHADLIGQLTRAAPRSVFLDIDFSSPSKGLEDAVLEGALIKPRDYPVMLPVFFQNASGADPTRVISSPLPRFALRTERAVVNAELGPDGLVRNWRNSWQIDGEYLPSVIDPRRQLPESQDVPIDFSISPSSFSYFSYVDLLDGRVPREALAGKTVFVGGTALELGDMLAVPVYRSLPGIVVQALAAETVNQGAPRAPSAWASFALLGLWAALAALLYAGKRGARWLRNMAALVLSVAGIATLSVLAFVYDRLLLDTAAPILLVSILFVAATVRSLETQTWRALSYALGMRRRDALLKSVVQSSTDCIVCIDEAGIIKTANPAASRLFGCATYELVDEPIAKFITLLAGDGAGARLGALHGVIRECDARTLEGDVFPVEISVSRVRLNTERLYTAIVRDIRERRAQHRRLQHQATHDSLTGLPNRAALLTHLEYSLSTGPAPSIALLMLDLCRFKEVNDTLGHNIGDRVLCDVAQRFQQALGNRGLIARIGGDEFTVVLDQPEDNEVIASASQLLTDCLRKPIDVAGISIEIGVSIGIARFPQDASDAQTLLRHADVAMYVAKRRGAPYEYYDAAYDENTVRKLAIGGELRSAIANNALELHFQPQVNLRSGMVDSAEALLRWFHPTQGAIGPDEFIAIAEATDLIRPLTEYTLRGALRQIRAWRERGVHVRIAVNLSARLLQDTAFPARLRELLEESGVSAASLELEITESAMMLDPARALRVVQEIDKLGTLISIDDFGTGYSSLGYLRDLPVHSLKLDKSFVMGMRNNTDDRIIVESTAQMAHALKLELVAEGVETEWDAQFLAAAGYDYAQGYRYSRALPADKCLAWIVEFNATAMLTAGDTTITTALRARAECEDEDFESRSAG